MDGEQHRTQKFVVYMAKTYYSKLQSRAGGLVQVAKCLLSKLEDLSLNPHKSQTQQFVCVTSEQGGSDRDG